MTCDVPQPGQASNPGFPTLGNGNWELAKASFRERDQELGIGVKPHN